MNAVLDRLLAQRGEQVAFIDQLLTRVDAESRDLVDAEQANLAAARERIAALDAQIEPIREFEEVRTASAETAAHIMSGTRPTGGARTEPRPLGGPAAPEYASVGDVLADLCRASGFAPGRDGRPIGRDDGAALRVAAIQNQTTTETPGLLPTPIVGQVVNLIDARRPLITSMGGARPMGNIPGAQFYRPKVVQHTTSGKQTAEKTALASRQLKINPLTFAKETHGGCLNVSRQEIDWTSPAAWNIIVQDLADSYSVDTENTVATAFATGAAAQTVTLTTDTPELADYVKAMYDAAVLVYKGCKRLPDRIWCSLDMWASLGAIVDQARLVFPPDSNGIAGTSDLREFSGIVLALPRIVVPDLAAKTLIVGNSTMFEVYEETIGLLSAIEPSILGVEVAYGGYIASGFLEANGFATIAPKTP